MNPHPYLPHPRYHCNGMIHRRFVFPLLLGLTGLPSIARPAPEKPAPPTAPAANLKKLQAGCDGGKAADCLVLAEKSNSKTEQIASYKKACKLDDGDGCAKYGFTLLKSGPAPHGNDSAAIPMFEKALQIFEKECLGSVGSGCEKYLFAYENSAGISGVLETISLRKKIIRLSEKVCRMHPPDHCVFATEPTDTASYDDPDPSRAVELYRLACDSGSGIHCASLAQAFHFGTGIERNDHEAEKYFNRSVKLLETECAGNNVRSCDYRAKINSRVYGTEDDSASFNKYLELSFSAREKSCKAGEPGSCNSSLGDLAYRELQRRKGITKFPLDTLDALSCQAGDLDSCKKELEQLSKTLDDKEKKTVFTVEQIKTMGTRFFEINRAMRRHCRDGDLSFCIAVLDTRLPDFEHAGLSEAREKLVASLLALHLRDACEKDDLTACEKLSEQYKLISDKAVNPDHLEKIAKLFEARCRAGNLAACVEFHARKLWQGLDADPARAEKYLEETAASARLACARGQTAACADQLQAEFFLGAGRPELPLHPELAADAALTQFESGKFCDGMSQSECADALFSAFLELPDPALAIKRFDRLATGLPGFMKTGCEGGNGKACLMLAAITKEPLSPDAESNPESRDAPAKNLIAYLENAWALKPDAEAAAALLGRGTNLLQGECRRGDFPACALAAQSEAEAARDKTPPANPPTAEDPLKQSKEFNRHICAGGDAPACGRLGDQMMREISWSGVSVKNETSTLLLTACQGGESRSCLHLARLAIEGKLISDDESTVAATLFRSACEAKVGSGCRQYLLLRGRGQIKSEPGMPGSKEYLEQGCEYGDLTSCEYLAMRLIDTKDESEHALQLLRSACGKGESESCDHLGYFSEHGKHGIAKDLAAARAYYQRACDLGSTRSCENVKELEKPEVPEEPGKED